MSVYFLHPELSQCRRLFLRDYEAEAWIGVHGYEKESKQRILINVDVFVPLQMTRPVSDDISEVIDYDFIRTAIENRLNQGHIHLQETLVDDIADKLLQRSGVLAVRVSSQKIDIYPECESVGVEILRFAT
ncbi:MAG: dihydroneopterin aldolase [Burkholderiales bacterium]|jgi:dihydroneopterin aldolase|nr:dihydroneopterin aldolase [Burkholderiales bacterium]MCA3156612.1 dihydroneopterin aldolase [Burkholderiales bacterium]MCA3164023.1 dihydroneopterin aldolase [Burkholderiales bacterium]MCA3167586.1 dihydroneopterin aldolase [Burkholderiales bacterium]